MTDPQKYDRFHLLGHSFRLRVEAWCKAFLTNYNFVDFCDLKQKNYAYEVDKKNSVDSSYLGSIWFFKLR